MFSKQIYLLFVFLLFLYFPSFIAGLGIIGGVPVSHYPFFVTVEVNRKNCGGTLVAPNAVVTAAHCLYNSKEGRWTPSEEVSVVKVTERRWRKTSTRFPCEQYLPHEIYNPESYQGLGPFDIAVIKLADCFDLGNPQNGILKPCRNSLIFDEGLAIGNGLTRTNPNFVSEMLMQVRLHFYPYCATYSADLGVNIDEGRQICFGSRTEERPAGTCDGDSGGPIVFKSWFNAKATCLIGVASFSSPSCTDPLVPSVFTRADVFARWIKQSIRLLSKASKEPSENSCRISK